MTDSTTAGATGAEKPSITIPKIEAQTVQVPIVGTAPLIVHAWSQKAKQQMLDAQQGRKTRVKQDRDPQADYLASLYHTADGGYGFPVLGFKAATVGAARFFDGVKMTELRQFIFMSGVPSADGSQLLVPIVGEPKMREDMVRVGMGTDLRYRGEFTDWSAVLVITFVATALSVESLVSLIDAGGMGVGVGEWRPEKRGQNGTYEVDSSRDVEMVRS